MNLDQSNKNNKGAKLGPRNRFEPVLLSSCSPLKPWRRWTAVQLLRTTSNDFLLATRQGHVKVVSCRCPSPGSQQPSKQVRTAVALPAFRTAQVDRLGNHGPTEPVWLRPALTGNQCRGQGCPDTGPWGTPPPATPTDVLHLRLRSDFADLLVCYRKSPRILTPNWTFHRDRRNHLTSARLLRKTSECWGAWLMGRAEQPQASTADSTNNQCVCVCVCLRGWFPADTVSPCASWLFNHLTGSGNVDGSGLEDLCRRTRTLSVGFQLL